MERERVTYLTRALGYAEFHLDAVVVVARILEGDGCGEGVLGGRRRPLGRGGGGRGGVIVRRDGGLEAEGCLEEPRGAARAFERGLFAAQGAGSGRVVCSCGSEGREQSGCEERWD